MKPYGNSRRDNISCSYGCCVSKYKKRAGSHSRIVVVKRGRHKARQEARKACNQAD